MTMRRLIAIAAQHRGLASIPVASSALRKDVSDCAAAEKSIEDYRSGRPPACMPAPG